jgi:uncharacterized membrane protein
MMSYIRKCLVSGLLIWLPIWITFLALHYLISMMDNMLKLLPKHYQPDYLLGFHITGLGLLFTFVLLFATGLIARNVLGRWLVYLWDKLIDRIPLVRAIYTGVKKMLEMFLGPKAQAFRKVLLVEYPHSQSWTIAFQTGQPSKTIIDQLGVELVTVFIPTTPIPTSGFMLILPKSKVHEVEMTIDEALRMIISLGAMQPPDSPKLEHRRGECTF